MRPQTPRVSLLRGPVLPGRSWHVPQRYSVCDFVKYSRVSVRRHPRDRRCQLRASRLRHPELRQLAEGVGAAVFLSLLVCLLQRTENCWGPCTLPPLPPRAGVSPAVSLLAGGRHCTSKLWAPGPRSPGWRDSLGPPFPAVHGPSDPVLSPLSLVKPVDTERFLGRPRSLSSERESLQKTPTPSAPSARSLLGL